MTEPPTKTIDVTAINQMSTRHDGDGRTDQQDSYSNNMTQPSVAGWDAAAVGFTHPSTQRPLLAWALAATFAVGRKSTAVGSDGRRGWIDK